MNLEELFDNLDLSLQIFCNLPPCDQYEMANDLAKFYALSPTDEIADVVYRITSVASPECQLVLLRAIFEGNVESHSIRAFSLLKDLLEFPRKYHAATYFQLLMKLHTCDQVDIQVAARKYLLQFAADDTCMSMIRYKCINELCSEDGWPVLEAMFQLFQSKGCEIQVRIYTSQQLLQDPERIYVTKVRDVLLGIALSESVQREIRADVCDVLINTLNDEEARNIIQKHLRGKNVVTIYEDLENVHNSSLKISYDRIILDVVKRARDEHYQLLSVDEIFEKLGGKDVFSAARERIALDSTRLNDDVDLTLSSLLQYVYSVVLAEKSHTVLLQQRLREELMEMTGTCTSGYASRLVNIFSGVIHEFTPKMNMKEQIKSRFMSKIASTLSGSVLPDEMINEIDVDKWEEFRLQVIDQMIEKKYAQKAEFNKYIRCMWPTLQKEIEGDFCRDVENNEIENILIELGRDLLL